MKNLKILSVLSALILFSACTDILNKEDPSNISPEIWDSEESATLYINSLYNKTLPEAAFGENAQNSDETGGDSDVIYGNLTTSSIGLYSLSYYADIKNINIAIEETRVGALAEAAKERLLGQSYFMRAWMYWRLVQLYGGVPLILNTVDPFQENLTFPRDPTSECINQITADLDSARAYLPAQWSSNQRGRISRGAAAALKGRVLLYWASPQFNPQDNQERWQRAYTANTNAKGLLDQDGYGLTSTFGEIFTNEANPSVIFARLYSREADRIHGWENTIRPPSVGGNGGTNPTWELVKAFPMQNGMSIDNPASGYDSTKFFMNRDPRFYETIVYNGMNYTFEGFPDDRRQWHYYVDGSSVESGDITTSGFYNRKAEDPTIPRELTSETGLDWIEIRYAEVLMNLAESANATGNQQEAYNQLAAIRNRAGIDPGPEGLYGLEPGMGREAMTDAIMKERQVEFAFENQRYWDLRRRNLFTQKLNGTRRHGLQINLRSGVDHDTFLAIRDSISVNEAYDYFTGELLTLDQDQVINFPQPKYNFFAIPPAILQRSGGVEQTQGWNGGNFDPLQ